MTLNWENGRQLQQVMTNTMAATYTYDVNGLRTSKWVNGLTTNFVYLDGKLVAQYRPNSNERSAFIYDENGHPYAWHYVCPNGNFTPYLYITNLQGDVIRIVEANNPNNIVAQYGYNAFGAIVYQSGSMASLNPLRYRGYIFDNETGLYYLQSRYYDPVLGRFVNADEQLNVDTFLGYNMFAYCENDPVNLCDPDGRRPVLRRGSRGAYVRSLQTMLNQHGANLAVDGVFGPLTRQAVINFQRANRLIVDGIVGSQTWGSLTGTSSATSATPVRTTATPSRITPVSVRVSRVTPGVEAKIPPWVFDLFVRAQEKFPNDTSNVRPGFWGEAWRRTEHIRNPMRWHIFRPCNCGVPHF